MVAFLDGFILPGKSKQNLELYEIKDLIRTCSFGAIHKISDDYVVKYINLLELSKTDKINIAKEILIGQYLSCVDCNDYAGIYLASYDYNMVRLYMKKYDIDFFDYIVNEDGKYLELNESNARQIIHSVKEFHKMGLIHFDIKMENFLCKLDDSKSNIDHIVLADFGLSDFKENFNGNGFLKGTPRHVLTKFFLNEILKFFYKFTSYFKTKNYMFKTALIKKETESI
jgi:serine/threonine protein kinase